MGRTVALLKKHSGWLAILTLAIIGTPVIWTVLQPREPNLPRYEGLQAKEASYYPGGPDCRPPPTGAPPIPEGEGQRQRCAEAAEDHRLKEDDLRQQTRSADAAEAIVGYTYNQSTILVAGTILGFFTLVAAAGAAWYARSAAAHTRAGAITAKDGLDHARDIASQEMRPWLTFKVKGVSEARMGDGRFGFDLDLLIENVGKFPARDIRARGQLFVNDFGQMTPAMEAFIKGSVDPHKEVKMVVLPGKDHETNIQVSSDMCDLNVVERPNAFIDVTLIVKLVYGWVGSTAEGQVNCCYTPISCDPSYYSSVEWRGERLHLSYFRPTWPISLKDRHYTTTT